MRNLPTNYRNKILKKQDAWSTVYIYDPISLAVIVLMVKLGIMVSPNTVTLFGLLLAILAASCLYVGQPIAAVLLLQIINVIDCIDGKWARLNGISSEFGQKLDAAVDLITHGPVVMIIAVYIYPNSVPAFLVLTSVAALLTYIHMKDIFSKPNGNSANKIHLKKVTGRYWTDWTAKKRLIRRPISEVELAFVLPSVALLENFYNASFFITLSIFSLYLFFRAVIK